MPLHVGELEIDAELARRLVAARLPELADLPITEVRSTGTVNALFRIGDDLCARLASPEAQKALAAFLSRKR
jgi:aminoglycoside phosphotransferase (APT) family kinase protein